MHQRNPWRRWITTAVAGSALLISGVVAAPAVSAVPSRDINQVRTQVRDLQARAEAATERYNKARSDLAAVQDTLDGLHQRISRERAQLQEILSTVDDLARSTYTSGGMDSSLQVLLADNPSEFLAQAAALDQVAQSQTSALRRTQTARLRLAQSEAEVKDKEAIAQKYRDDMASSKEEADQRLNEAEGVLAGLEAAERARLAAIDEAERQAGIAAGNTASANLSFNGPSSAGGGYAGGGRASAAVSYALSQVGDRYVAAAAGPDAFDCSGLMLAAWRQAGVSLPHYSYSQYSSTRRIPLSEAQPGDLVFYFGGGVHHVGMYVGNGKMVHAANPGDGVIVSDVLGPWYENYFSGVGRVVG
ncbi:MAG: C40 family peptidase [Actinobacteria bacterium]|nr:C40 family peptidase [Actinomycetota bacterium]